MKNTYFHNYQFDKQLSEVSRSDCAPSEVHNKQLITETARKAAGAGKEDNGNPADHVLGILRYVSTDIALQAPSYGTASEVIENGKSICLGKAIAFTELCRALGIPSRRVHLFAEPVTYGHVVAEVFIEGDWRFFDPTYAAVFRSEKDNSLCSTSTILTDFNIANLESLIAENGSLHESFTRVHYQQTEWMTGNDVKGAFNVDQYFKLFQHTCPAIYRGTRAVYGHFLDSIGPDQNIAVWGSSTAYRNYVRPYLLNKEIEIQAIVDNDPDKWGKSMDDMEIIPPNQLKAMSPEVVLVCASPWDAVVRQVRSMGLGEITIL